MKITELKIERFRRVRETDENGKQIERKVKYMAARPVEVIQGGKRFAHFFVDIIAMQVLFYFIETLISLMSNTVDYSFAFSQISLFLFGLFGLLSYPIYYIVCEHFWQKTLGKYVTKTTVINEYAEKPDLPTNILRNLIRMVPFEPFSCLNERGWHDRWSDTFVVPDEELEKLKALLHEQKAEK